MDIQRAFKSKKDETQLITKAQSRCAHNQKPHVLLFTEADYAIKIQ